MKKKKYVFKKTHEVDKEEFAALVLAAKGGRTMKDFADECGANPSTFTRIVQKANKGASSTDLIEAIAEHADPKSGVTVEKLAKANGYTATKDIGLIIDRANAPINSERLLRDVLTQELLDRNQTFRMGSIRYTFSKNLELSPDALIMTDAFGHEDEVWFVDSFLNRHEDGTDPKRIASAARRRAFDRLSRFAFIAMNKVELFRPTRFSLAVFDRVSYEAIVDEFEETVVPTDISIILIDTMNSRIAEEYMLPHITDGHRDSYFMTTPVATAKRDNVIDDTYDDE